MDILKRLQVGRPGIRGLIPCKNMIYFIFSKPTTLALRSRQPPIQIR